MPLWKEIKAIFREEANPRELLDPTNTGKRLRDFLLLVRETLRSIRRDDAVNLASALAFKSLLALVPVLAITLAIVSLLGESSPAVPGDEIVSHTEDFITSIKGLIPSVSGMDELFDSIRGFAENAIAIGSIGFIFLFFTAYSLLSSMETAFNTIWKVRERRKFVARLNAFLATIVIVPILMSLSVYMTTHIARAADNFQIPFTEPTTGQSETNDSTISVHAQNLKNTTEKNRALQSSDSINNEPPTDIKATNIIGNNTQNTAPTKSTDKISHTLKPKQIGKDNSIPKTTPSETIEPIYDTDSINNPTKKSKKKDEISTLKMQPETRVPQPSQGKRLFKNIVLSLTSLFTTCMAMTAMFYLLPFTYVRLKAALTGGLITGIFFEIAIHFFRYYAANHVANYTKIYGPLLALPLFLLWVWLVWVIVLVGAEIAFAVQNFRDLAVRADLEKRGIQSRLYLAIRIVLKSASYHHRGEHPSGMVEILADELRVPPYMVREIIGELINSKILKQIEPHSDEAYLPAKDISVLNVLDVVDAISSDKLDMPESQSDPMRDRIGELFATVNRTQIESLGKCTFTELVLIAESTESPPVPTEETPTADTGKALPTGEKTNLKE